MKSTQRRLSAAAWSMIDALAGLRRSVQQELDFIKSVSTDLPTGRLQDALMELDFFTSHISSFLSDLQNFDDKEIEDEYQALASRYSELESLVDSLLGR